MFDLGASDPIDLQPGDHLEATTEIRRGDVVCFERTAPDRVLLRALTPDELASHDGPAYRIDRGEGGLTLTRVGP